MADQRLQSFEREIGEFETLDSVEPIRGYVLSTPGREGDEYELVAKGLLVLGERKVHAGAIIAGCYARAMQWRDMTPEEIATRPEARLGGLLLAMVIVAALLRADN